MIVLYCVSALAKSARVTQSEENCFRDTQFRFFVWLEFVIAGFDVECFVTVSISKQIDAEQRLAKE